MQSERIYTEELISVPKTEDKNIGHTNIRSYNFLNMEDEQGNEEVDPYRPVTAEVFEPGNGGFMKVATKKPEKKTELGVEVDPVEEEIRLELEDIEEVTTRPVIMQAPKPKPRPLTKVIFEGIFGKISAGYLDVYLQGMYVILVERINSEFSYSPPESDDLFTITVGEETYEVLSPGINFELANQKIKTTILLRTGD